MRDSSYYLSLILLAICMLLSPAAGASNLPPQKPAATDSVSTVDPGAELWHEVRQREGASLGSTQASGVDAGVLINARGDSWARFRVGTLIE